MEKLQFYVFSVLIINVYSDCPDIHLLHGSAVITKGRYISIHYECNDGYDMFGPGDSYCLGGHWATPVPVCHAKGCSRDEYQTVANGMVNVISKDSLLIVTCDPGFIMDGNSIISCDGLHWSEPLPNCYSAIDINQCDFEHQSFCGWTQEYGDYPDWEINSGNTSTTRTGPAFDHTYGHNSNKGHYIFMESSIPRQYGHVSRLFSPLYPRYKSRRCFELWYHMLGPEEPEYMGDLEIILHVQNPENYKIEKELFKINGNQGDEWHKAVVFIELLDTDFQIVVKATRGRSHTADIAVDDFSFYKCTNDSDLEEDIWATDSTVSTTSNEGGVNNTSDGGNYTTINYTTTEGLQEVTLQQNISQNEAQSDSFHESRSSTTTQHIPSSSSIPTSHSTEAATISSTVETMTLPKNPEFHIVTKTDKTTDFVQHSERTTTAVNVHIGTDGFMFYPIDIEHPSENMALSKKSYNLDKALGTTSASVDKHPEGENLLFNPVFISIISGLCAVIVVAVVIVSIIIYKRRQIWGRKTSDDQVQVLYLKNRQSKEPSQNV